MNTKPIGVFDSGVGGLTVCKAMKDIMPGEHIIYFGDTGRFPYGTRSIETIIRYSREITDYLKSRDVKMIVIACNTSSAAALDVLRRESDIPVLGVIDAGARAACKKAGKSSYRDMIGVIATRATVKSESYVKAVQAISPRMNVLQRHATIFVSLTEEGWIDDEITRLAAKKYIQEIYDEGVRVLILGCTHFPLLKKAIQEVYPDIELVDSGVEVAWEAQKILKEKNLENSDGDGGIELYTSDITDSMERMKELFFGNNGTTISKLIIDSRI
ncbi:MAG TPA: glutamate racemase [Spirochaetota bacterium]|nr:glutamate racemase [Spirochaetota bacterium]HPJ37375.1 glutamate racemase [Spirochaetota bacterium]HPQ54903.1 glutamate racemase [Spirochaetota bacterium]